MKTYSLEVVKDDKYVAVVYSSSYINPFEDVSDIVSEIKCKKIKQGYILFDLLLSNGNNFNRFAKAYFDGNNLINDSIVTIEINSNTYIEQINRHYKNKIDELENSVLSKREINLFF